jgi:hypothetical protein
MEPLPLRRPAQPSLSFAVSPRSAYVNHSVFASLSYPVFTGPETAASPLPPAGRFPVSLRRCPRCRTLHESLSVPAPPPVPAAIRAVCPRPVAVAARTTLGSASPAPLASVSSAALPCPANQVALTSSPNPQRRFRKLRCAPALPIREGRPFPLQAPCAHSSRWLPLLSTGSASIARRIPSARKCAIFFSRPDGGPGCASYGGARGQRGRPGAPLPPSGPRHSHRRPMPSGQQNRQSGKQNSRTRQLCQGRRYVPPRRRTIGPQVE